MVETEVMDRLAPRARPPGSPVMAQTWERLLFLHWPIDAGLLRPMLPPGLTLDLFEGQAWIGLTPFSVTGLRAADGPGIPGLTSFHELNVRTYVHANGFPGVWFFSLDASKIIPVLAARVLYSLPYLKAAIEFMQTGDLLHYKLERTIGRDAEFEAIWRPGLRLREAEQHSLAFFLTERYCLYAARGDRLYQARVYHAPWILEDAELISYRSTMLASHGLPEPAGVPLIHYSERLQVEIWPSRQI